MWQRFQRNRFKFLAEQLDYGGVRMSETEGVLPIQLVILQHDPLHSRGLDLRHEGTVDLRRGRKDKIYLTSSKCPHIFNFLK